MDMKKTQLAVAIAALVASPLALAENGGPKGDPLHEHYNVSVNNSVSASSDVNSQAESSSMTHSHLDAYGSVSLDGSAMAVVDDKQINSGSMVTNTHHQNNAFIGDEAAKNVSGNIAINNAAGDNNMQDNAAAISALDASFVFGSANARTVALQKNSGNETINSGNVNNAVIAGTSLQNAKGNIAANVAAGTSNLQKNNMSISVANARVSEANVASVQRSGGNMTMNAGRLDVYEDTTSVTLNGGMGGGYAGIQGGVYRGTESGRYSGTYNGTTSSTSTGTADQYGNVYLDVWAKDSTNTNPATQHPTDGGLIGHIDVDSSAQGAKDLNGDGGAFAFKTKSTSTGTESGSERGSYSGSERGQWGGIEMGAIGLEGTFTGNVTTTRLVYTPTANNATLAGGTLKNASGNIGVNVAAGTGNLQNNSMALAATYPGAAPTPVPGPGPGE